MGGKSGPAREDGSGKAAARCELAADDTPFRVNRGDNVLEDFVDRVFVKNAQAAVSQQIHFQGLELDAVFLGHVLDGDGAEIGQARFGAHGRVFGKLGSDDVAWELIWPSFEFRQFRVDAGASVFFGLVGHSLSGTYCTVSDRRLPLAEAEEIAYSG